VPARSASHLVLVPSYNPGAILAETVREALEHWSPVWVVVDGSTDGSDRGLEALTADPDDLRVIRLPENCGKGAAVLAGAIEALRAGFGHVLTLDADGQHPASLVPAMMAESATNPGALVLGRPVFGADAPAVRVLGRQVSNFWVHVETLGAGVGDSLFGMRVYPAEPLVRLMRRTRWARRFDFDPEMAVRLVWDGARPLNVPAPVRYLSAGAGGVSHFRYLRDNALLTGMHLRLVAGALLRLPVLLARRWRMESGAPPDRTSTPELARRVAGRFRSRYHRSYARCKLRTDPLYHGVLRALGDTDLPVLDLGCGLGLLAFFLREHGFGKAVTGVDSDAAKVRAAAEVAEVYHRDLRFVTGDAREGVPGFEGNVTLLDLLQFFDRAAQRALLVSAARAVAPGGRLVVRTGIDDGSRRFRVTRAADRLARWLRWMPAAPVVYPTLDFLAEVLRPQGLVGRVQPWWGRTPFNNYLAVFERPSAD
jgi:SAM-dependent methyltransferase